MDFALNITGKCVYTDEQLYEHIHLAMARGLPEVLRSEPAREGHIAIVCSGPSVLGELDKLREIHAAGIPLVAIRDAHDWLIANDLIPTFALSVDPLPTAAECFAHPHPEVQYLLASQSHPRMFDYLEGMNVGLWHCYMKKGQTIPAQRMLIAGGTTSGLRALAVFYVLGWRNFLLFGMDSCLSNDVLRLTGEGAKPTDPITSIRVESGGEEYFCNAAMALQAQQFQDNFDMMTDATFQAFGRGLIKAILDKRTADDVILNSEAPIPFNGRISFIHEGGPVMASYRYRAQMPASWLGAAINDWTASTLIFSKIQNKDILEIARAKKRGQWVIVDFCDDHFPWPHYQEAVRLADAIICSSEVLKQKIAERGRDAVVIPESYEYPLVPPHFSGQMRILWFGNAVNRDAFERIYPDISEYPVRAVSNFSGDIPWSHETMIREFADADIVVIPAREEYKTANRTVEALRQGCFVAAEPQPSLMEIPGIYIGNIKEGLEWIKQQTPEVIRHRISLGATYVTEKLSPQTLAAMWRDAIRPPTTSDAETNIGAEDGLTSIPEPVQT